ncbi:MAG: cytochrome b [Magnetococcales bacterium]|nr:cytochrome b [Magnetococcales bacterium]MBF0437825.1 cytochrome b [Magnetococcales bacterium]
MNTDNLLRFTPMARWIHWGMALLLILLVGLGFYAISLTYYDPYYHRSVFWHRSLGILAFMLLLLRISWRLKHAPPPLPETFPKWERLAATLTHLGLYVMMGFLPISGYLMSTADGHGVNVFGWFELPALLPVAKGRETWAGMIHLVLAVLFCSLVLLHVLAALKHHFINRDGILRRMW